MQPSGVGVGGEPSQALWNMEDLLWPVVFFSLLQLQDSNRIEACFLLVSSAMTGDH